MHACVHARVQAHIHSIGLHVEGARACSPTAAAANPHGHPPRRPGSCPRSATPTAPRSTGPTPSCTARPCCATALTSTATCGPCWRWGPSTYRWGVGEGAVWHYEQLAQGVRGGLGLQALGGDAAFNPSACRAIRTPIAPPHATQVERIAQTEPETLLELQPVRRLLQAVLFLLEKVGGPLGMLQVVTLPSAIHSKCHNANALCCAARDSARTRGRRHTRALTRRALTCPAPRTQGVDFTSSLGSILASDTQRIARGPGKCAPRCQAAGLR